MEYIQLRSWNTGIVLFEGHFASAKACLQQAIDQNVSLDYVLLENMDLAMANLDGAVMNHARIQFCNLRDANLSEITAARSQWAGCDLSDACFQASELVCAQFQQCQMKDVNVKDADMRGAMVSCTDFLKVDFSKTTYMGGCVFLAHGTAYPMSRPPIFVRGLPMDVVLLDDHILLGNMLVLRHDQIDLAHHCLMDLASRDACAPEQLLKVLWTALRVCKPAGNNSMVA